MRSSGRWATSRGDDSVSKGSPLAPDGLVAIQAISVPDYRFDE
jgi:hypothetical protein